MWEQVSLWVSILVCVALFALLPLVWDLPEIIKKYFRRSKRLAASSDPDEAAAHALGDALRRGQVSAKAAAEITAAFWAADRTDRRALAYLVAGMCDSGRVADKDVLAVVRSRRSEPLPPEEDSSPHTGAGHPDADLPHDGIRPLRDKL